MPKPITKSCFGIDDCKDCYLQHCHKLCVEVRNHAYTPIIQVLESMKVKHTEILEQINQVLNGEKPNNEKKEEN